MKIVNITDYGAVSDGTLQTEKIQKAIDDCFLAGAGEVIIPEGEFHTGGIRLRSNVTMHLLSGAKLIGSRDPDDYFCQYSDTVEPYEKEMLSRAPRTANQGEINDYFLFGSRWYNALIKAYKATNIKIIGDFGSVIDGNDCYDESGEEAYRGPHCICCVQSSNIEFRGYNIVNSSNWAHSMWFCNNIELSSVTVNAGHDGCHWRFCRNIYIHDCDFSTGDDCVAGYNIKNIVVENCSMNTACSAFRLGPTNALIQNCRIYGPPKHLMRWLLTKEEKISGVHDVTPERKSKWNTMLSVFTYASVAKYTKDNPENENIIFRDCTVNNVERFMHFNFSGNEPWQSGCPLTDITYENISAENIKMPLTAYGDAKKHINITIKNTKLSFAKGSESSHLIQAANYDRITLENVSVKNATGNVLVKSWSDGGDIRLSNVEFSKEYNVCERQTVPFECKPI